MKLHLSVYLENVQYFESNECLGVISILCQNIRHYIYIYIYIYIHGSLHLESNLIIVFEQNATRSIYYFSVGSYIRFGC